MTTEEYIAALKRKNKGLDVSDDVPVTVTARGLWAMVRQAWEKGAEHAKELSDIADSVSDTYDKQGSNAAAQMLFNKMFGGKK